MSLFFRACLILAYTLCDVTSRRGVEESLTNITYRDIVRDMKKTSKKSKKAAVKETEQFLLTLGRTCAASKGIERAPVHVLAKELSALSGQRVTDNVVYNWCSRGSIAYPLRPYVARLCIRENVDLPKDLALFGPGASA